MPCRDWDNVSSDTYHLESQISDLRSDLYQVRTKNNDLVEVNQQLRDKVDDLTEKLCEATSLLTDDKICTASNNLKNWMEEHQRADRARLSKELEELSPQQLRQVQALLDNMRK